MQNIFSGRYNRAKYIGMTVLVTLAGLFLTALAAFAFGERGAAENLIPVPWLLGAAALVPVTVRRLHDVDMSGWWYLLFFVPVANVVLGFRLLFKKGTQGPNRFGPDPLSSTEE